MKLNLNFIQWEKLKNKIVSAELNFGGPQIIVISKNFLTFKN